jgi:diaminopimelate epimerase
MKMHGLGNDFVVLDARAQGLDLSPGLVMGIADRHKGIGFDQLAVIEAGAGDAHLTFYNADGSTSAACGNATRCIARHLMDESGKARLHLTTARGDLYAVDAGEGLTSVNMGQPQLDWNEIPLAEDMDTLELPIEGGPTATGMGNPHCTFFVPDAEAIDLAAKGAAIEHHPLYPERTNVQFASLAGPDRQGLVVGCRGLLAGTG